MISHLYQSFKQAPDFAKLVGDAVFVKALNSAALISTKAIQPLTKKRLGDEGGEQEEDHEAKQIVKVVVPDTIVALNRGLPPPNPVDSPTKKRYRDEKKDVRRTVV